MVQYKLAIRNIHAVGGLVREAIVNFTHKYIRLHSPA
jgi:hypothetical protein